MIPPRSPLSMCSPHRKNTLVEQVLDNRMRVNRMEQYLFLCAVNTVMVAVLAFDLFYRDIKSTVWNYVEFGVLGLFAFMLFNCLMRAFGCYCMSRPVQGTRLQLMLLDEPDTHEIPPEVLLTPVKMPEHPVPLDSALSSWHPTLSEMTNCAQGLFTRKSSKNNSPRHSPSPHNSFAHNNSSHYLNNTSFNMTRSPTPKSNTTADTSARSRNQPFVSPYELQWDESEKIYDLAGIREYIRNANSRKSTVVDPEVVMQGRAYGFWNYYNKTANLLRSSLYQLSPYSPTSTSVKSRKGHQEECLVNLTESTSDAIKSIPSEKLSGYTINLRRWLSSTILKRLVEQIDRLDASFVEHGFTDIQLGAVSLERLRKIIENRQFVMQYFPMLTLLLPFLELCPNQEYLVKRLRDLADGPCISQYCWNGGGDYGSVKWNEHLPNDTAILFHVFCVYMDSQLLPLPQGEGRAFFSRYVVLGDEKRTNRDTIALVKNRAHCAILYWNPIEPKFNFISDNQIHNCVYNRNNLFYVLIDFLMYMRKQRDSMLEGINMGPSGINIICTIEE